MCNYRDSINVYKNITSNKICIRYKTDVRFEHTSKFYLLGIT